MRRFLIRLCVVLVIAVVALVLGGWLALRGSLAQLDGQVVATALSAPVQIERDVRGTVTLHAQNRLDLNYAIGFVHAQDRFFQMDLMRRSAAGELAEMFGAAALPIDRKARAHRMRARAAAAIKTLPESQRRDLAMYRDGVNAGLAALAVRPFPYLLTLTKPTPWRIEDTLLVVDAMSFTLNDAENARELGFSRMRAALPDSVFHFLTATGGEWDAPLTGDAMVWPATPPAQDLDLRGRKIAGMARPSTESRIAAASPKGAPHGRNRGEPSNAEARRQHDNIPGSNSFAVAGGLADGGALVANDMHLALRVPGIWFRARFVYPDPQRTGQMIDVTGASLPGAPVMVVGSNRHVAWGFTNSYADTSDWVRVIRDPHDASRYRTPTGWQAIAHHAETIRVKDAADVVLDVQDTQWGPIIASDVDGTPLALAWTAQQPGAVNMELEDLERVHDVKAALTVAHRAGIPPQNFVVGDNAGHIAWTIAGKLPRRVGGFDNDLPADWSTDSGWNGWLDNAEIPVIDNPDTQRIWTANQRVVDGDALATLGDSGYDLGARARQIRDALQTREHFTPADMLAIQLDDRALFLAHWRDLFVQTLQQMPDSPLRAHMQTVIANQRAAAQAHGFRAATDSVTYRLVRAWRNAVIDHVLDGFTAVVRDRFPDFAMPHLPQAEQAVWQLIQQRPQHLLPPDFASWDELLVRSATEIGEPLDSQPGGLANRTWGERNTASIRHPVSRALPDFVARWLDMPSDELAGDSNMPRVAAPAFGASERFAVTPGDEEHGYFELAGGQSGHPLSPFHGAGHADWVAGRPTPFLPGAAVHRLELRP